MFLDPTKENFLHVFFRFSMAISQAQSESDLTRIHNDICTYQDANSATNLDESQAEQYELALDVCQCYFNRLLWVLYHRRAQHLKLPHNEELMNEYLDFLVKLPIAKWMEATPWLKLLRYYLIISAKLIKFEDIVDDDQGTKRMDSAKKILSLLYILKKQANETEYPKDSGLSPEFFQDLCSGLPSIIQSTSIKDSPAETLVEEYAHHLLKPFIQSLLLLHQQTIDYQRTVLQEVPDEIALSPAHLFTIQSIRNQNTLLNAILYRLNLQAHPLIRTLLQRSIEENRITAEDYLSKKMHQNTGRRMVLSILFELSQPDTDNMELAANQFKQIMTMCYAHLEDLEHMFRNAFILKGINKIKIEPSEDTIENYIGDTLDAIPFLLKPLFDDVTLLRYQALAILPPGVARDNFSCQMQLISGICAAYRNIEEDNPENQLEERLLFIKLDLIDFNYFISDKITSAFHALVRAKHHLLLKKAGNDPSNRNKVFKEIINDLESFLNKRSTVDLSREKTSLINVFLKDCFFHILMECRNKQELDYLNANDLQKKILNLSVESTNQDIYEFLFDFVSCLIEKNIPIEPSVDLQIHGFDQSRLQMWLKKSNRIDKMNNAHQVSSFTLAHLCWLSVPVAHYFMLSPLSMKAFNNNKLNTKEKRVLQNKLIGKSNCRALEIHSLALAKECEHFIAHTSPTHLEYRNPSLKINSALSQRIDYPNEKSLFISFFKLHHDIEHAESSTDIETIEQIFSHHNENIKDIGQKIEDNFGTELNEQTHFLDTERKCMQLLEILLIFKRKELNLSVSSEEIEQANQDLKLLCDNVSWSKYDDSNFATIFTVYIKVTAQAIELIKLDPECDNHEKINELITKSFQLFHLANNIKVIESKFRYKYHQNLSKEYFKELIAGLYIMSRDKVPQTDAERFTYRIIKSVIDKMKAFRSKLEDYECQQINLFPKKAQLEFTVSFFLFQMRQQLSAIDIFLSTSNLCENKDLRKKYESHLNQYRMREEYCDNKWQLSSNRIFSLAGLIDYSSGDPERIANQLEIAAGVLLKYSNQCAYTLGAIYKYSKGTFKQYEELQSVLKAQLLSINLDASIMLIQTMRFCNISVKLGLIMTQLSLSLKISETLLWTVFHEKSPWTNLTVNFDCYDIPLHMINDKNSSEGMSIIVQSQFVKEINTGDPEERISSYIRFRQYLLDKIEVEKETKEKNQYFNQRVQFITDMYLYAYLLCQTEQEFEILTDPITKIKESVFKLMAPPANFNSQVRDFMFGVGEHRRADCANKVSIPETKDSKLIFAQRTRLDLIAKLESAKDASSVKEHQVKEIPVHCRIYLEFVNGAEEFIKKSEKLNKEWLKSRTDKIKKDLDIASTFFSPQNFTYRPINCFSKEQVAASFVTDEPQLSKSKKRSKVPARKKEDSGASKQITIVDTSLCTAFKEVCELYKEDLSAVTSHYFSILKNESFKVKNDDALNINAVLGLMSVLPLIIKDKIPDNLYRDLKIYASPVIGKVAKQIRVVAFGESYLYYEHVIKEYKKVRKQMLNESKIMLAPVESCQNDKEDDISKSRAYSHNLGFFDTQRPTALMEDQEKKSRILHVDKRRPLPDKLLPFKDIVKDIALEQIELSSNELQVMKLLYQEDFVPLLQGGIVVDSIRKIPYRDADGICFASAAELDKFLTVNKDTLNIDEHQLFHKKFFRIYFKGTHVGYEREHFDVAFIFIEGDRASRKEKMAAALTKMAKDYALGMIVFYCYFNHMLIDPLRQSSRIKAGILDVALIFDEEFNIDQFFATYPDRMLVLLAKDAKCARYDLILDSSFIKEAISRNIGHAHSALLERKFPQALFDKLFIHGFSLHAFMVLHQCDLMHVLFPMFSKTKKDIGIMRRACLMVFDRYQHLEKLHKFDPSKRVPMLPIEQENYLRITFIHDLMHDKFFELHPPLRYLNEELEENELLFRNDVYAFLFQSSFTINKNVIHQTQDNWWKEMKEYCDTHRSLYARPNYSQFSIP